MATGDTLERVYNDNGYQNCKCRDCFSEPLCGHDLCDECEEGGCLEDTECAADDLR